MTGPAKRHESGKATFDHVYSQPDPRAYFAELNKFEYRIPQYAAPTFLALIDRYRMERGQQQIQVLDIACSYGVNAALLRCDVTLDDLYTRYRTAAHYPRRRLVAYDRELVRSRGREGSVRFVGLDVSRAALTYAHDVGFLDDVVNADLEHTEMSWAQRTLVGRSDLVISTGALSYVGSTTLTQIVAAAARRAPWLVNFAVRTIQFGVIAARLDALGYDTIELAAPVRQRRFVSEEEQTRVLATLNRIGLDPHGFEADGWLYAQPYLSLPRIGRSPVTIDIARSNSTTKSSVPVNENLAAERSVSTFGNDEQLPRLPIPTLEDTCERFLERCSPLLTAEELTVTVAAVEQLLASDSPARTWHAEIERFDRTPGVHSWLDTFWTSRHLGRRDRIALNANFFFLFADSAHGQLERAAELIARTAAYKLELDAETVPPVMLRGRPLSMHQNRYLFSTTRIPGIECDTVRSPYSAAEPGPSTARHIVVHFRRQAFRLDILAADGTPYPVEDLIAGLNSIRGTDPTVEFSPGALTTKPRAAWATTRQALIEDPDNLAALETIETALFSVALEDSAPQNELSACNQLLYGDGGNRWYDKALTFIVFVDGRAGVNIEHCGLDGTTVLSFCDAVLASSTATPADKPGQAPAIAPIEFRLNEHLQQDIRYSAADFDKQAAETATAVVTFDDFGSDTAKRLGISPDALVQVAYQLAHQRARGLLGTTYESIAMRHYRHGRTEALRAVTPEVVRFVALMNDSTATATARAEALRAAAGAHVARARDCQAGRAPERHLAELQRIQRQLNAEPLAIYESPGWTILRDDYLSTSSVPSANIRFFGFGPTTAQCIGIGYVLLPGSLNIYLSAPQAIEQHMRQFAHALHVAIPELCDLLVPASVA
ncbi:choline/carnitine O-acyltransferase [Nocardia sp. NBC_00403]|uniref:choline/carnitine O-acyltransferase n=1 Tax=Nocardia sp. NBC_00403 TaxID=2975990 RepID=UPI002E1F3600